MVRAPVHAPAWCFVPAPRSRFPYYQRLLARSKRSQGNARFVIKKRSPVTDTTHAVATQRTARPTNQPTNLRVHTMSTIKFSPAVESLRNAFARRAARMGSQGDIKATLSFATLPACAELDACGITPDIVEGMTNQKAVMCIAQAGLFIATGVIGVKGDRGRALRPSLAVLMFAVATAQQPRIGFADARYLVGARETDPNAINGVSRAKLHSVLGGIKCSGTVRTQVSQLACSPASLMGALGITRKVDAHTFEIVSKGHPLVVAYCDALESASEGQLRALRDELTTE